jgi:drug/metabolite transporter (DMT)-like permease
MVETVLGITYVWIILGEAPTIDFIIGAAVVMLSITANSLYQARIRKES